MPDRKDNLILSIQFSLGLDERDRLFERDRVRLEAGKARNLAGAIGRCGEEIGIIHGQDRMRLQPFKVIHRLIYYFGTRTTLRRAPFATKPSSLDIF
jgi:hypothetical protein